MKKKLDKRFIDNLITYAIVIAAYVIITVLMNTGNLTNLLKSLLIPTCAYIICAISLNLTVGVLGELSLGHAGFMSIGAFAAMVVNTIMLQSSSAPTFVRLALSILVAAIAAAIFGFIVGMPALRLQGDYLAIVTLAFGQIFSSLLTNTYIGWDSEGLHFAFITNNVTLEDGGVWIINGPMGASTTKSASFTLGFILIMICLVIVFNLVSSKTGRAIMAFRDNRIAAESIGIKVNSYKLMTFIISAAIAGVAGALYGLNSSSLLASKFDYNTSILLLVYVVLGGLGNMRGSIIATAVLNVLPELLRAIKDYRMVVYAILLIVIMLVKNNPTINGWLAKIGAKIKDKFKKPEEKDEEVSV